MEIIYTIVTANDENDLINFVNSKLKEGWQCQGGISSNMYVIDGTCYSHFSQAIIKQIYK